MFSANASFLIRCPLVQEGLDLVHDFLAVLFARDVEVHVAVADVTVSRDSNGVFAQPFLHDFDTEKVYVSVQFESIDV